MAAEALFSKMRAVIVDEKAPGCLALGEVDDLKYATAAGAINYGFPVVADTIIPQILPTGVTTYEHVISMPFNEIEGKDDLERAERIVQKCIEVRGVKVRVTEVPIPVPYGSAFEGERVRRERFFERMEAALRAVAAGDSGRPLPRSEEPGCEGAVAALQSVLERLRDAVRVEAKDIDQVAADAGALSRWYVEVGHLQVHDIAWNLGEQPFLNDLADLGLFEVKDGKYVKVS